MIRRDANMKPEQDDLNALMGKYSDLFETVHQHNQRLKMAIMMKDRVPAPLI